MRDPTETRHGWLSQVILGVHDLPGTVGRLVDLGFGVVAGGRHPDHGTGNAFVPLGRSYLEILSIVDRAMAGRSGYATALATAIRDGERLVRWSLRTSRIDEVAAELGFDVEARRRIRPLRPARR